MFKNTVFSDLLAGTKFIMAEKSDKSNGVESLHEVYTIFERVDLEIATYDLMVDVSGKTVKKAIHVPPETRVIPVAQWSIHKH